jgi:hypothetical protein
MIRTVEGVPTLVIDTTPPLPQKLPQLLGEMFGVTVRQDIHPSGASNACEMWRTHRFDVIREGRHLGRDRVLRDLRIQMCLDCGAVCVRDISYDRLDGLPAGGKGPSRRDHVLGWYSGARRNQRSHL